jgi:hypothetical protein
MRTATKKAVFSWQKTAANTKNLVNPKQGYHNRPFRSRARKIIIPAYFLPLFWIPAIPEEVQR